MRILIEKRARTLRVYDDGGALLRAYPIALGFCPVGHKTHQGDGKTPEGEYAVCFKRECGKYGPSLALSYPSARDAEAYGDTSLLLRVRQCEHRGERPPWGSALGGEIYIHGGGAQSDWTAGCVALADDDMRALFDLAPSGTPVTILP